MKLMTISEVTNLYSITTRMLRYYDEIGLLASTRMEDYAYRVYDESAVRRLQQILLLRKLRIPLKKIAMVLESPEINRIIAIFHDSVKELNDELTALHTIKDILNLFITRLNTVVHSHVKIELFEDAEIMSVMNALSLSKYTFKEDLSMNDLNKANETLSTLKDVRIIYLPPCTVAASHYFGENPEEHAGNAMNEYVMSIELQKKKPDLRMYGFNNPSPKGNETYGYEFWVTIPEDIDVPDSMQKKQFSGGLYAAHCIKMGDFHEWEFLAKWVENSTEYGYDAREPLGMDGCLEEHLNVFSYYANHKADATFTQLDLLMPIKAK